MGPTSQRLRSPKCSGGLSVLVCRPRPLMGPPAVTTASTCPKQANSPLPKAAATPPVGPTPTGRWDGGGWGALLQPLHPPGLPLMGLRDPRVGSYRGHKGEGGETPTSPSEVPRLDHSPGRSQCKSPGVRPDPSQQVEPWPETRAAAAGGGGPTGPGAMRRRGLPCSLSAVAATGGFWKGPPLP